MGSDLLQFSTHLHVQIDQSKSLLNAIKENKMSMLLHLTDWAPATGSSSTLSSDQVPCGHIFAVTVGADTPILAFTKFISATRTHSTRKPW